MEHKRIGLVGNPTVAELFNALEASNHDGSSEALRRFVLGIVNTAAEVMDSQEKNQIIELFARLKAFKRISMGEYDARVIGSTVDFVTTLMQDSLEGVDQMRIFEIFDKVANEANGELAYREGVTVDQLKPEKRVSPIFISTY